MSLLTTHILERVASRANRPEFLDAVFGPHKRAALDGAPVALFGAGALGEELCATLRAHGVFPVCFCDNDASRGGTTYFGLPVVTYRELRESRRDHLVVVASHKYLSPITEQLRGGGFAMDRVFCKSTDAIAPIAFMYAMIGTQCLFGAYHHEAGGAPVRDVLREHERSIDEAHDLLTDDHSKGLLLSKLAVLASEGSFELFREFILTYSQPVLQYGSGHYEGTPEDYYYFNNDVFSMGPDEVYVDVGAYDGDTVRTFVDACRNAGRRYRRIYAFEPDPSCYDALRANTAADRDIVYEPLGLWSASKTLRFRTSDGSIHDQAGGIDADGNVEIRVVSLDDYLQGAPVTLIKMDPGGNVIPDAVRGAAETIRRWRPKLALGAYHAVTSLFEIPLLVHRICPDYRLFLRHNTYHLCDTDLLARL